MYRILLVTHGPLAGAFKESSKMFFGEMAETLEVIGLYPSDSPESLEEKIKQKVGEIDDGNGVLIFVDIFAGSPFNMTALSIEELKDEHSIECFTGVNMPLLMESLANSSMMKLNEAVSHIENIAGASVVNLRKELDI